jgi:hypothetical protein
MATAGCCGGELSIKVDKMVAACCERNPGGSIADTFFRKRLSLISMGRGTGRHMGRAERYGPHYARQREENE